MSSNVQPPPKRLGGSNDLEAQMSAMEAPMGELMSTLQVVIVLMTLRPPLPLLPSRIDGAMIS